MLDVKTDVVSELKTILPTYYEQFVDSTVSTPCITYFEYNNVQNETGDTLVYSEVTYCVKVWGKSISDVSTYSVYVDAVMCQNGFRRISSNELVNDGLICKVLLYRALGLEIKEI